MSEETGAFLESSGLIFVWMAIVIVAVPVAAGMAILWLDRRDRSFRKAPAITAVGLWIVLGLVSVMDSPGGDVVTPGLASLVSLAVAVAVYVVLRRRGAAIVSG